MLSSCLQIYLRILKGLLTGLLFVMIVPVCLQIVSRYTGLIPSYIWTEEVARFCFVWMIMIGSVIAVKDESHFDVDLIRLPDRAVPLARARIRVHAFMIVLALVFAWFGFEFTRFGAGQHSEMSGINLASIYGSFPFAGLSWCVFLFEKIAADVAVIRNTGEEGGDGE